METPIPTPTLCLCMIVKNESRIITRMLDTVVDQLDAYCICDTGSTDSTVELVREYFSARTHINGIVFHEPFRDFEYNRNVALQVCFHAVKSDFVLLVDADMVPQWKNFDKSILRTADAFTILQGSMDFMYHNTRIIRNNGKFSYRGVTHEYIDTPPGTVMAHLSQDSVFILDIGDGGCKSNKAERDIGLLTKGLVDEPKNERYMFYLANTYFDCGKWDLAEEHYRKRIAMGGWYQEIWYSWYRIGLSFLHRERPQDAMAAWLEAYEIDPLRLENMYEIIKQYRLRGKSKLVQFFYERAEGTRRLLPKEKKTDFLFLCNDVYTYKLGEEWTISAFYTGVRDIRRETLQIIKYGHDMRGFESLVRNMKFYDFSIPVSRVVDMSSSLVHENIFFRSSSPSLVSTDNGYLMNVRLVNYSYDKKSGLITVTPHPNIITLNMMVHLNAELQEVSRQILLVPLEPPRLYLGVEDVRLYRFPDGETRFLGTGYHQNDTLGVVSGKYPHEIETATELVQRFNPGTSCEKNWVHVLPLGRDTPLFVYRWHPLQLCRRNEDEIVVERVVPTPPLFAAMRGSTHGCVYVHEIWFLTHLVEYNTPRRYYHMVVVFDEAMTTLRRVTAPFVFENQNIEYCLGLVVEKERLLCSYSTWDETSKIAVLDRATLPLVDWENV